MSMGQVRQRGFLRRLSMGPYLWACPLLLVCWIAPGTASGVPNEQQLVALYCRTADNRLFQKDTRALRVLEES